VLVAQTAIRFPTMKVDDVDRRSVKLCKLNLLAVKPKLTFMRRKSMFMCEC